MLHFAVPDLSSVQLGRAVLMALSGNAAQLVEHPAVNRMAAGSSPAAPAR